MAEKGSDDIEWDGFKGKRIDVRRGNFITQLGGQGWGKFPDAKSRMIKGEVALELVTRWSDSMQFLNGSTPHRSRTVRLATRNRFAATENVTNFPVTREANAHRTHQNACHSKVQVVPTVAPTCVDAINPMTGVSDCSARRSLCNDPRYYTVMTEQCPRTCNRCTISICLDLMPECKFRAACGYCITYRDMMYLNCPEKDLYDGSSKDIQPRD
ncbi:unnamed protein product, partial [Mesorhabditis belari]|uniref:ShKT domain-containing protein n=1 Tax=Mesorhabditis belari TaxID=2138241 RepID=A0AAF3JC40_9BILA